MIDKPTYYGIVLLIGCLLLAACGPAAGTSQPTATALIPATTAATNTPVPADTAVLANTPLPTDTVAPPATQAPTAASSQEPAATPTSQTGGQAESYLDDRSTAASLMQSYVNALNTFQYLRAYSYWSPDAAQLQPFEQFEAGFSNTKSTHLTLGTITGDAGAGQLYYAVPAALITQTNDNARQTFVGCYILHLAQPGIQGTPPFRGLSIDSAQVQQMAHDADVASLLDQACQDHPGSPLPVTPTPDPDDISPTRYLDDRSNAVQVLRSLFNAVNRHEYVRAYSYWEPNASGLPPFDQFEQGYTDTLAVQLEVGPVVTDAGAGQRYYQVPVTLVSTTTDNTTETFVGCYVLHLGLPDAQAIPPYQGIGIRSASVDKVANNADTAALMAQACQ